MRLRRELDSSEKMLSLFLSLDRANIGLDDVNSTSADCTKAASSSEREEVGEELPLLPLRPESERITKDNKRRCGEKKAPKIFVTWNKDSEQDVHLVTMLLSHRCQLTKQKMASWEKRTTRIQKKELLVLLLQVGLNFHSCGERFSAFQMLLRK